MKTLRNSKSNFAAAGDYLALVRRFPLRRIRAQAEHRRAIAIIDELMAEGDERLSDGQSDYLEALARFVTDYERDHALTALKNATPLEVLKHLMESRHMTPSQFGDVIGSRSAATMILKGEREMSKPQIRTAAEHFNVSPALFL